eukprot:scaffold378_cov248-Pinguiococcus_pyrenoidosus.AAC.3
MAAKALSDAQTLSTLRSSLFEALVDVNGARVALRGYVASAHLCKPDESPPYSAGPQAETRPLLRSAAKALCVAKSFSIWRSSLATHGNPPKSGSPHTSTRPFPLKSRRTRRDRVSRAAHFFLRNLSMAHLMRAKALSVATTDSHANKSSSRGCCA